MSREDVSSEKTSALMQVLSELADLFDLAEGAVVVVCCLEFSGRFFGPGVFNPLATFFDPYRVAYSRSWSCSVGVPPAFGKL